jgi:hypothetical protein
MIGARWGIEPMAIQILYGRGGSGKSLLQMHLLVEQLRTTKRNVVTNLSVNLPALNAYLEKTYPDESLRAVERIRLLTTEETKEFWKHRGPIRWTGNEYEMQVDQGVHGTCFIVDEAGAAGFSAQEWAAKTQSSTRGVECAWYLDQQRKFGDQVIASTNGSTPAQIAKGFRDKAHEFIRLKNEYQMKWGAFRGRGRIVADYFIVEPSPKVEAFKREVLHIDREGLASCYWTERGVGVVGTKADIGTRAKGIPILWTIPLGIVVASLCGIVPWALGKGAGNFVAGGKPAQIVAEKSAALKPVKAEERSKNGETPARVCAVLNMGGELMVGVEGQRLSRVVGLVASDGVLLENGAVVRRADVLNPPRAPALAPGNGPKGGL